MLSSKRMLDSNVGFTLAFQRRKSVVWISIGELLYRRKGMRSHPSCQRSSVGIDRGAIETPALLQFERARDDIRRSLSMAAASLADADFTLFLELENNHHAQGSIPGFVKQDFERQELDLR
jgi:hypothetical protein